MSNINCVPPEELHDRLLVSEYYAIPKVFELVKANLRRSKRPRDYAANDKFTVGPGHIKFFYTRLNYLAERQADLIAEMILRKMRPNQEGFKGMIAGIPNEWFGSWKPKAEDLEACRADMARRLDAILSKPKRPVLTPYNMDAILGPMEFKKKEKTV